MEWWNERDYIELLKLLTALYQQKPLWSSTSQSIKMANYVRYEQVNRLRDKSSLFFLCSFVLVVVYTSVIGFVIVHVLKITKNVEDNNEELLQTNKLLEEKLERLIIRLEKLEDNILTANSSRETYVNIVAHGQLKPGDSNNRGKRIDNQDNDMGEKNKS